MPTKHKAWWEKYGVTVSVISAVMWAATILPRYATLGFYLGGFAPRTPESVGESVGANLWVAAVWFLFIYSASTTFRRNGEKESRPEGAGGWLALFIVGLVFFVLKYALLEISRGGKAGVGPRLVAALFLLFALATATLLSFSRKPVAVTFAKVYLLLKGFTSLLLIAGGDTTEIGILLYCAVWLLYFHKSKRVQNTYFPQTMQVFGLKQ